MSQVKRKVIEALILPNPGPEHYNVNPNEPPLPLTSLSLKSSNGIRDDVLLQLRNHLLLDHLDLTHCGISDSGLEHLGGRES